MKVKMLMSKDVLTVDKDRTIIDAIEIMRKNRVGRLPVVDKELEGIVSTRDIIYFLCSRRIDEVNPSHIHVSTVMKEDPITVKEDVDSIDALRIMLRENIGGIPVVNGKLKGIITKRDFLFLCKDIEKYTGEIMKKPITVAMAERITKVAELMRENNTKKVIVTDGDAVTGIITEKNVLNALLEVSEDEHHRYAKLKSMYAESCMTKNFDVVYPDIKVSKLTEIMMEKDVDVIPVVDYKDKLVGIVRKTDILELLLR